MRMHGSRCKHGVLVTALSICLECQAERAQAEIEHQTRKLAAKGKARSFLRTGKRFLAKKETQ